MKFKGLWNYKTFGASGCGSGGVRRLHPVCPFKCYYKTRTQCLERTPEGSESLWPKADWARKPEFKGRPR